MEKYNVKIKKINWLDNENPEAEVLFELGGNLFWAFCHPCDFKEEEETKVHFTFLEEDISDAAFWGENNKYKKAILPSKNYKCSYYCYGQIQSINPTIIDCGTINFLLSDWINDKNVIGSYVYFVIARLDIIKIDSKFV